MTNSYRFLFAVAGGHGHLNPVLPAAHALAARGHAVSFVADDKTCPAIEALGFAATPAGPAGGAEAFISDADRAGGLERVPFEQRLAIVNEGFGRLGAAMATDVLAASPTPPAVVVRETSAWAGWFLGDAWGVPVATVDYARVPSFVREIWSAGLNRTRTELGLPPDPGLGSLDRWLGISPVPAGWLEPHECAATTHLVQPGDPAGPTAGPTPSWLTGLEPPVVYATLGTVFNRTEGLWEMIIDALSHLPVSAVATVGDRVDPASFGPLPDRIRVERYIPQGQILPHCAAVVSHGGFGTITAALAAGLPIVSLPLGAADNVGNAMKVERLGAGLQIGRKNRSVAAIADALARVLDEPAFGAATASVAAATRSLPPPEHAATLLEQLAATGEPSSLTDLDFTRSPRTSRGSSPFPPCSRPGLSCRHGASSANHG